MPSLLSKIRLPNGSTYTIKDEYARSAIAELSPSGGFAHSQVTLAQYNALDPKDSNTIYFISGQSESLIAIGDVFYANYVPAHCTAITASPTEETIGVGESFLLSAYTTPTDTSDTLVWSTSNNNVTITNTLVSSRGNVTGAHVGTCVITATCGEVSTTCTVTIHEAYVYTEHILVQNYTPNGEKFKYTAPIAIENGQYIEISIDISTVTGTKENIISIGQNINVWGSAGSGARIHMYDTASNRSKVSVDLLKDSLQRRPTYTASSNTMVIVLDKRGLSINGTLFTFDVELRATPTLDYTTGMNTLLALSSYDIGSQEGNNRSNATYNYIKYYTTETVS